MLGSLGPLFELRDYVQQTSREQKQNNITKTIIYITLVAVAVVFNDAYHFSVAALRP